MAQSLGKKVARIFSVLVAALLICSAAFLFTACETDHPKIKMTIEFNDKSYELTYKLYRNMYPKTVAHYLELIDMDFYDNTVIHDYSTSSSDGKGQGFYGGGYYMQEDNADRMAELDYEKATMTNDSVTLKNISVRKVTAQNEPLNTLYGEFSANGFKVANNGLTHKKGSLATHYNAVSDANGKKVRGQEQQTRRGGARIQVQQHHEPVLYFFLFQLFARRELLHVRPIWRIPKRG